MGITTAAVFSAALVFGSLGQARVDTSTTQKVVATEAAASCSEWYEQCYTCGEPGYWVCVWCRECNGRTICDADPCGGASTDKLSSLFTPAVASRPLSCRS